MSENENYTVLEKEEVEVKKSKKGFAIGAIVGAVVGATTALMVAPKSGKALRSDITNKASELKGKTDGWKEVAMEKSSNAANMAKDKTVQIKDLAMEKGSQLASATKEKTSQLKSKKNDWMQKESEAVDHALDKTADWSAQAEQAAQNEKTK